MDKLKLPTKVLKQIVLNRLENTKIKIPELNVQECLDYIKEINKGNKLKFRNKWKN